MRQAFHAFAQLALDSPPFLFAHVVQSSNEFLGSLEDDILGSVIDGRRIARQGPGKTKNHVQIRLRGEADALGRLLKSAHITFDQSIIHLKSSPSAVLNR